MAISETRHSVLEQVEDKEDPKGEPADPSAPGKMAKTISKTLSRLLLFCHIFSGYELNLLLFYFSLDETVTSMSSNQRKTLHTTYKAEARCLVFFHACSLQEDDDAQNHRKHVLEWDRPDYSNTSKIIKSQSVVQQIALLARMFLFVM